MVVWVKYWEQ